VTHARPRFDPSKTARMRILIADDNEINRKRLRKALASKGHETEEVSDGVEALEKLRSGKFDAVISDVLMPRMDGYRLSYEVRRSEELRDTQIIIYSSTYTSLADKRLALKVGVDRFIPYSVSPTVILRALEDAARKPRKRADVAAPVTELDSLKEYSAILVRRLKEANLKLGTWNKRLARANEALRAAEQRSRVLMEKAKDVILVLDSRGVILEANQAAEELYGRPRARSSAATSWKHSPPRSATPAESVSRPCSRTGTSGQGGSMCTPTGVESRSKSPPRGLRSEETTLCSPSCGTCRSARVSRTSSTAPTRSCACSGREWRRREKKKRLASLGSCTTSSARP
jgi:CheY-like chemotaxis protein